MTRFVLGGVAPRARVSAVLPLALLVACLGPGARERGGEGEGETVCVVDGEGVLDVGEVCSFNADCLADLRCGCVDGLCACESGPRGCGLPGDPCADGNDCNTALCVEGDADFVCSAPCGVDEDCPEALPVCAEIALVGRICIRAGGG